MDEDRLVEVVELVRRIRHDANNPLTAALGHVQLILIDDAIMEVETRASLQIVETRAAPARRASARPAGGAAVVTVAESA